MTCIFLSFPFEIMFLNRLVDFDMDGSCLIYLVSKTALQATLPILTTY
jgi:hypothetical protein